MCAARRASMPTWKIWLYRIILLAIVGGAIYISPRGVAVVVASLAIVAIAIIWWIKMKIRKFVEPFKNFELIPSTVDLKPTTITSWHEPEQVERETAQFRELGFEHAGDFTAEKMADVNFRGFIHTEHRLHVLMYDMPHLQNKFDIVTAYEDGSYMTYTNSDFPELLERPPTQPIERLPNVDVKTLFDHCIANRPDKPMKLVPKEELAATIKSYVEEEHLWRIENAEQEDRLRDLTEETFLNETGWSAIEWNRKEDRVLFIHERLRKMDAVELFMDSIRVEDSDHDRIQSMANNLVAEMPIRKAFSQMIELPPAGQAFEKLITFRIDDNVEVDAYLAPELPDDDDVDDE